MKLSSIAGRKKVVKRLAKGWNVTADEGIVEQIDELFWRRLCKK